MNKILWNLINTRKMVSFIDDMLVRTKIEKGHNEIVEKVIKRLAENNLFIIIIILPGFEISYNVDFLKVFML